jgi:aspartate/methionine/tyrosine aminotransferase
LELASFYSCSKGYMGECGLRAGYVEFMNLDPDVYVQFKKMSSAKLCSTILGQVYPLFGISDRKKIFYGKYYINVIK